MSYTSSSVLTIVFISTLSAVSCKMIGSSSLYRSLKCICSLSILICVLYLFSPIISQISDFRDLEYDQNKNHPSSNHYNEQVILQTKENISKHISELITQKFEIDKNCFSTSVEVDQSDIQNVKLKEVILVFKDDIDVDFEILSDFISEELICKVTVIIDDK